jgi:hypothetical protein
VQTRKAKHSAIPKFMNRSHHPRATTSPESFRRVKNVAANVNTMEIATQK